MKSLIKYQKREINVKKNPIMIIGMCPGRVRKGEDLIVFHGNRTGDFIEEIIKPYDNLVLTNIFNYYVDGKPSEEIIENGKKQLAADIEHYKPMLIICLGHFAFNNLPELKTHTVITKVTHPSWFLRFNKNKEEYKKMFRELLNEGET